MANQREETWAVRRRGLLPRGPVRQLIMGGCTIVVIGDVMAAASGMPLLAVIIAGSALALFSLYGALHLQATARFQQEARRAPQQPYPTAYDLGEPSRALLQRAVSAIEAIMSSQVCRDGLVNRYAVRSALADQQRDITLGLREQARLHAMRAELPPSSADPMTADVNSSQVQAAQLAESGLVARVETLERYATEIREADAAYRDWQHAAQLTGLHGKHPDALARTPADEHRMAAIEVMSLQARGVRLALREPPGARR